MTYAYTPGSGQEDPAGQQPGGQGSPGNAQPGFAPPGARKTWPGIGSGLPRTWRLLIGVLVIVAGIIAIISGIRTITGSTPADNFNDPAKVAAVIKSQADQKLADPSSSAYQPGVTVTSVTCTKSGNNTDSCLIRLSNGAAGTTIATISDGGTKFTYHAA